jgi:uncharacterized membrane protein
MENKKEIVKERSATGEVAVQKNIETILRLEKENLKTRSTAEQIANKVTTFAGSTLSLLLHAAWFGGWILLNLGIVPGIRPFDPLPFSFLTLVVSLEAIFLTLLVLMSQNRMTREADKRANLDLQINMLDEQETTMILRVVQKIAQHLGLQEEINEPMTELSEETDVNRVSQSLDEKSDK